METTMAERDKWLEVRRSGIGGSDIGAIMGISPYKGPLEVWADKMGKSDWVDSDPMWWGRRLESVILEKVESDYDISRIDPPVNGAWGPSDVPGTYRSLEEPVLLATPDAVAKESGEPVLIEIKTSRLDWDGVPEHYEAQVQHYMCTLGLDRAILFCLHGGQRLIRYDIDADREFQARMKREAREFWETYVEPKVQPPLSHPRSDEKALASLFPQADQLIVPLSGSKADALAEIDRERETISRQISELTGKKKQLDLQIKEMIGEHAGIEAGKVRYTYKTQSRNERLVPASSFRVLRRG